MKRDPLDLLQAIRPPLDDDTRWASENRDRLLRRIMATPPPSESSARPQQAPHRRLVPAMAAAAVFSVAGVGAATAAGVMPAAFTDTFGYWATDPVPGFEAIDPADGERVASIPGPDGTVFSVLVARGADGYRCTTAVFEAADSAADSGPSDFTDTGSECRADTDTRPFGAGSATVFPSATAFVAPAGEASSAEVRLASGDVLPTILFEGQVYGWFPTAADDTTAPVLVGLAGDGSVVGEVTL